ncbi:MAG: hypothetical protein HYV07_09835 [Deltaproteobacteria bacterium]|nr:hypothetical protein [Deltaproteobacteria bacterium]
MRRLVLCLPLTLAAQPALALEASFSTSQRVFAQSLSEEVLVSQDFRARTSTLTADRFEYQFFLSAALDHRPVDALGLHFGVSSGLVAFSHDGAFGDGLPLADHAKRTLFLGRVSAELELGETGVFELELGRLREDVGRGLIYDAYAFGLVADADLGLLPERWPWHLRLAGLVPDGSFFSAPAPNPLVSLEVELEVLDDVSTALILAAYFDNGQGVTPFFAEAAWRDRIRALTELVGDRPLVLEVLEAGHDAGKIAYDVDTLGELLFVGLALDGAIDPVVFSGAVVAELGSFSLRSTPNGSLVRAVERAGRRLPAIQAVRATILEPRETEVAVRSAMAQLEIDVRASRVFSFGGFAVLATGDDATLDRTFSSYIGLAPRLGYTSLFFSGGVSSTLVSPSVVSVAPDGAGVFAVGARAALRPARALKAELTLAFISSLVGSEGGQVLGEEADLDVELRLGAGFSATLSLAAFRSGPYYGDLPLGSQGILGLSYEVSSR